MVILHTKFTHKEKLSRNHYFDYGSFIFLLVNQKYRHPTFQYIPLPTKYQHSFIGKDRVNISHFDDVHVHFSLFLILQQITHKTYW